MELVKQTISLGDAKVALYPLSSFCYNLSFIPEEFLNWTTKNNITIKKLLTDINNSTFVEVENGTSSQESNTEERPLDESAKIFPCCEGLE